MTKQTHKVTRLSSILNQEHNLGPDSISLCYGHFNAIHPGHLRYFQTARKHGEKLFVALEGDEQLSEFERTQQFSQEERAQAVAALDLVDLVIILDSGGLDVLIGSIRPSALVFGREFERERSKEISGAVDIIKKLGGKVVYDVGETHYATADLFHGSPHELEQKRWYQFKLALKNQRIELDEVFNRFLESSKPRILVVGDTIVDRYVACDPIGLSSEAPVVVVKELETRDFIGGASIVAGHIASLGGNCVYVSVAGRDDKADFVKDKLSDLGVVVNLLEDVSRPTTFKIRYLIENQKLFRVSKLKEHRLSAALENQVIAVLENEAPSSNAIVISDFVYGVVTPKIVETATRLSQEYHLPLIGDLQCSSQFGDVSKFKDFDLLCPTEREARLALNNQDDGIEYVSNLLMEKTRASNLVIKLGTEGLITYCRSDRPGVIDRQHFPAISVNPVDVSGAGDSLLAGMVLSLTRGLSIMEAAALASCIAAIAVQIVGNCPVGINDLEQFIFARSRTSNGI